MFETIARVPLAQAVDWVKADENRSRGEFVLVVEGRPVETSTSVDPKRVLEVLLAELSVKQAAALAAKITGRQSQRALPAGSGDGEEGRE